MLGSLVALTGLAFLDALDVLLVGAMTAIVVDSRLARRSPVPGGLAFLGGVFAITTAFGIATVLGLGFVTDLIGFRLTPGVRAAGELLLGVALIAVACLPASVDAAPPAWTVTLRRRPILLGLAGVAIGLTKAPTALPYLAGLAMLAALDPRPPWWPLIIVVYCLIALILPLLVLAVGTRNSPRSRRVYRAVARTLTRYGPASVRVVFVVLGVALLVDAFLQLKAR